MEYQLIQQLSCIKPLDINILFIKMEEEKQRGLLN